MLECKLLLKQFILDAPQSKKADNKFREHFTNYANFLKVAEIKDPEIIKKIKINYRLQYLKDCALGYFLDDRATNLINLVCS